MDAADQVIRYAEHDGASIAWSAIGRGPPLVIGGWWCSHLDLDWRQPRFRRFASGLAEGRTVIRYDRPGTGASDRGRMPPSTLDEELAVLEAVVAAADVGRVSLLGASSGGGVASLFAARHPDAVDRLVLYGTYARGADLAPPAAREAMLAVVRQHWGIGSRVLSDLFMPDATAAERDEFVEFQRRAATPEAALASLAEVYAMDSTGHLGEIRTPTLVLHRRDDRAIAFALGRDVAERIPHARFTALTGEDHFPWRGDADAIVRETRAFLGDRVEPARAVDGPDPATQGRAPHLTEREREVLRLVARGETDAEIAAHLVLSVHTVHRHVANIRARLGVPSRAAAAAWALRNGLI
ncbi:alpha/beta fold hydrolase [Agromyces bracchium]|uniref:Alpha/beta fold hydrolase n=1 Tax=Agromyces bracchium TaxID=88376 RepID=A0A6I3M9B9_9MICO|nr:alpha/beta fold hydrolase [Agromyces bracchium]